MPGDDNDGKADIHLLSGERNIYVYKLVLREKYRYKQWISNILALWYSSRQNKISFSKYKVQTNIYGWLIG